MIEPKASFASYKKANPEGWRGTCRSCGKGTAGRVTITLTSRTTGGYEHVGSFGASFCEPCAIKVFEKAKGAINV